MQKFTFLYVFGVSFLMLYLKHILHISASCCNESHLVAEGEICVIEVPLADDLPLLGFRLQREDDPLALSSGVTCPSVRIITS